MAVNKIIILALAPTGEGISGSDRIFIELAREISKKTPVEIITTKEGLDMCSRQKLTGAKLTITSITDRLPNNFFIKYLYKIVLGIRFGLFHSPITSHQSQITAYSSSDFWMDVIPAFLLKIRHPQTKWIATWYQTAPNPLKGFQEAEREKSYNKSALFYWLSQLPVRPLISLFADYIVVNNEAERVQFPQKNRAGKVFVMIGAVRLDEIAKYRKKYKGEKKIYDAVFQGRFHPQKGVVELVEIWKKVTSKQPKAKLVMIGDGPLMKEVKERVKVLELEKNIELKGYLFDGEEKNKIFAQSKLVLHPAFYDSGGMASAEAMAYGIPAVGFDLTAYESYYPQGMVKVKKGDLNAFANKVVELLGNTRERKKLGKEAQEMIEKNWAWSHRTRQLLEFLLA